jgi:hypothetical protein
VRTQYGNKQTPKADFSASDVWGKVGVSIDGSAFRTDGFPQVIANERGPVDTKAAVDYSNVMLKVDYSPNERLSVFGRGGYFSEDRDNAKITTIGPPTPEANDTKWTSFNGGVRSTLPDRSDLQARLLRRRRFHSNFMAVAAAAAHVVYAPSRGPHDAAAGGAHHRTRRDGAVVESRVIAYLSPRAWTGAASMARASSRDSTPDRHHRHAQSRIGRHAAEQRRLVQGQVLAGAEVLGHGERASGPLEQLQRTQPRDDGRHRSADADQPHASRP